MRFYLYLDDEHAGLTNRWMLPRGWAPLTKDGCRLTAYADLEAEQSPTLWAVNWLHAAGYSTTLVGSRTWRIHRT